MPVLTLSLLGPFSASLDDKTIQTFRTKKVQALLIYLAVEATRVHQRESLMTLLWPDLPLTSAQVNLRQAIYRLRQAIPEVNSRDGEGQVPLVLTQRHSVQINPDAHIWLDVEEFSKNIIDDPVQSIALYRGDYLSDFFLPDSSKFEEWSESTREELRRTALQALDGLAENLIQQGAYHQAQKYAWRQLEIDNLRESAYRQLMLVLAGSGQRSAALSQYNICQQRLDRELGIEPSHETTALYEQIQADALRQTKDPSKKPRPVKTGSMPVFLLTDIEGSTRLWDKHHQAMLPALMQHNAILEEHISGHGGRILELRGDGVKAVFEEVNPLPCVLAIQKAFAEAEWGEIGKLRIRMGLHGVPTVRKGFDYFEKEDQYYGPVLNHTARVMDAGWGSQILVTEQIRNSFPLPAEASWHDFGSHKLKNLEDPVKIYGLLHPDLPQQIFPPLRTLTTQSEEKAEVTPRSRNNLEPQPTPFIGRREELAALDEMLRDPEVRLVTVVGPGGMGKTRLALASAERQLESLSNEGKPSKNGNEYPFPDGVYFVPLAPLNDVDQIVPSIAKALNIPLESSQSTETIERSAQSGRTQREQLVDYLREKQLLIVLDNFEHLLDGAEIVSDIIQPAPAVQVLVTSRERLHIQEEQLFPIQGLEFPDWEAPEDPCDYTAMELFLQSAHRIRPDFELDADDMIYLTRICRLVGGMPLGIELAASWVDMLSLQDISAEIQKSFDILETDLRNVPERHRSIRAVLEPSWRRLSDKEQQVLERTSVFRGGFTRNAAQIVAGATIRILATFVSKSMLQFNNTTDRYQIHELLRQYGAEKLTSSPEDEFDTIDRLSEYFCDQMEGLEAGFLSGKTQFANQQITPDLANILAAWEWAITQRDYIRVDKAITGLCLYYSWHWRVQDALALCRSVVRILEEDERMSDQEDQESHQVFLMKRVYAKTLNWQGFFSRYHDHLRAPSMLNRSKLIIDELENAGLDVRIEKSQNLIFRGLGNFMLGEYDTAKALLLESLSISKSLGHHGWMLINLSNLGNMARFTGSSREAKYWYEQFLAEVREKQNPSGEVEALDGLGWAARSLMDYEEAKQYFDQSLSLARAIDDQWGILFGLQSLGFLTLFLGQFDEAMECLKSSYSIAKEIGILNRAVPSLTNLGVAQWLAGEFDHAERSIQESLEIAQKLDPSSSIFPTIAYAEFLTLTGRYREANDQIQKMKVKSQDIYLDRFMAGRFSRVLGWFSLSQEDYDEAKTHFAESIKLSQLNADDEQVAWSQAGLACAEIGLGNHDKAREHLIDALWTTVEIQGFIPLLFILPVTVLYLAQEDPDEAAFVYSQMQCSPFLTKVQLFKDIIDKYMPAEIKTSSRKDIAQETESQDCLWAAATRVLTMWFKEWMVE
jgi:DNA-binding SARP family transcriptional activator/predicted ATPase